MTKEQCTEYRKEDAGFIFQFYNLIPDLTVQENIEVVSDVSDHPLDIEKVLKALDTKSSRSVLQFVEKMNSRFGTTVVIITHNEAISDMADKVIRLKDGEICESRINGQKLSR